MDSKRFLEIRAELMALSKQKPLKGQKLKRAKSLMAELKRNGFTNENETILDGSYKQPTIKQYTQGTPIEDATFKIEMIQTLTEMNERGLTLEDVQNANEIEQKLAPTNMSLDKVLNYIDRAEEQGYGIEEIIEIDRIITSDGWTIEKALNSFKRLDSLENAGFDEQAQEQLKQAIGQFDSALEVITAIKEYGKREKIEHATKEAEQRHNDVIQKQETELKQIKQRLAETRPILDKYDVIVKQGLADEMELENLASLCTKFGGAKGALEALQDYESKEQIRNELNDLSVKKQEDIELIKIQEKEIGENEARIEAQLDIIRKNEAKKQEYENWRTQQVESAMKDITEAYKESIEGIQQQHNKYIQTFGKAQAYEDDLKMARVMRAVKDYPMEAREVPIEVAIQFIDGVARFLRAKAINPKIKPDEKFKTKYAANYFVDFECLDLIELARKAIAEYIARNSYR